MDILRKELTEFYLSQELSSENLNEIVVEQSRELIEKLVAVTNGCGVLTDASSDICYISTGNCGVQMGISSSVSQRLVIASSDEDLIYERIHPEDLVDKRFLEFEFFKFIDSQPMLEKYHSIAKCTLRMKDKNDQYRLVDNTTQILRLSPRGKVWLILCTYSFSSASDMQEGIRPCIVNTFSGDIMRLSFGRQRNSVLSEREKQVLLLIKAGLSSKLIADRLCISINTVNRHRQNILEKLSVANSVEAVAAATLMKIL